MATTNPVAQARLFGNVFVCMKCNAKMHADSAKVKARRVKCRKCGYKGLRVKNKVVKAKA